ncbi:restriction endonuclease subunit S [Vogesella sp. LIG4]|uniref:restriction endonuclease subunit S n=1 Tax=Vogesella sp. LIG4 TaxID=1192162 RepID=UPI00081FE0EB|nr:restriction endonuclease subunit S [Vogesella sp. LIG4]SCK11687.1 type I restriction enzyme, S subunit [Vogesella sp. LIG4]
MSDWQSLTLGDIFEISSSKRVLQSDWQSSGVPFYRAREIVRLARDGEIDNELFISEELFAEFQEKYGVPEAGDLMVSAVGTLGACYVVGPNDRFYYKDASVLRFKAKREICSRFFQHAFRTAELLDQVHAGSGSTVGTYTIERANSTRVRVPPLPEQRRIAAILDKADALRTKRREALAQLDRLAQSIFVEMFGDPVTNPHKLEKKSLGNLLKVKSGDFLPASEMASDGSYPVFGGNGINGYHDEYMFDSRQIVIGRVGVYCGCVHITPANSWVTDNALYVSEHDARVSFDFLAYSLQSANLNQYASQSAQPLISGTRIYPVEILVPPKQQQAEFIARLDASKKVEQRFAESSNELDALFASLQHRAFRGEL